LVFLVFLICACSKERQIVGKWQEVNGSEEFSFFADGTVTERKPDEQSGVGSYRFIDNTHLRMDIFKTSLVWKCEVSHDELTLTSPDGKKIVYKRI
jgi:hypothetical protein